jgi:hypothetical protein
MISEIKDYEMLEFLMTSDFEQEYKPDEFRYLLLKWRYFYRILHGKYEINKTDLNHKIKIISDDLKLKENMLINSQKESVTLKDEIHFIKNRKLSLKERLTGKIIIKEDENK